ncbi:MAG: undecaprenyldiphospho-muramoylpentapeptide beta-N-acetylglucosaminyltransferase [Rubrimonas sp.]|uniref:undecaprenyldiphospho-muramoylpentapeptide beta-N-acetylglucosaminyltransferase n=1 Tax=Rubrimonas sp. TaxID=2036015 RepID=UPI002FDD6D0B
MSAPLVLIAAGGTGGHMFPAQALAQEMLRRGWRVALSTDARGLRYAGGFPEAVARVAFAADSPSRGGALTRAAAPARLLAGAFAARRWLARARPACVAGFGGYPAFPALAAAWSLGLPRLIHEQNGVLGRVNRLFAARVGAVACGTWPVARAPASARLIHIGNPVRDAVAALAGGGYAPPGAGGPVNLLVFGGSQGASVFATLVPQALAALPPALRGRLRLVQQAREGEAAAVRAALAQAGIAAEVAPFFDDMPPRIAEAHLVICRSGASTVAELAVIGRPAILVPFPAAMDDHQTANAAALAEAGAALLCAEAGLTPEGLAGQVTRLVEAPERLAEMARTAAALGRPHAAGALADLVERLAKGRRPS